jgi:neurofibromin 1
LDARITQILSVCHDERLLSAVLRIVQNSVLLDSTNLNNQADQSTSSVEDQTRQNITYLQAYGFGGLWRFAGPFLSRVGLMTFD